MDSRSMALFLYTESSLHAGTGATLSYVDLPIQREVHSQHPVVYPSGLKGGCRELCEQVHGKKNQKLLTLFGPEKAGGDEGGYGGMGVFKEARVLLFPVRSYTGTFAWVTCPWVIRRLQRDLRAILPFLDTVSQPAAREIIELTIPEIAESQALFCASPGVRIGADGPAIFEEYEFVASPANDLPTTLAGWIAAHALPANDAVYQWWRDKVQKDLVVIPDEEFTYFVRFNTEIQTHVKIGENGIVEKSGPWNEESLPPDTLLYSTVSVPRMFDAAGGAKAKDLIDFLTTTLNGAQVLQICGDQSLGKGFVRATCFA